MPLYDWKCGTCKAVYETFSSMADFAAPYHCGRPSARHFNARNIPQFTEDRLRFWRGHEGSRYSFALGQEMPQTRKEMNRIAEAKGIEFISSTRELDAESQEAIEYRRHVDEGGKPDPWQPNNYDDMWSNTPPPGVEL